MALTFLRSSRREEPLAFTGFSTSLNPIALSCEQERRDIKYYAPVKRALIFAPENTEKGAIAFLKKVLPFLAILALSLPAGLVVQHIVILYGGLPSELPIDHAYIPLYVFVAGSVIAIMALVIIKWFIRAMKTKREEKRFLDN